MSPSFPHSTKKIAGFFIFVCFSFGLFAQDDGFIDYMVLAKTQGTNKPMAGASVSILSGTKEIQKLTTDKNGRAKVELQYGPKYKVIFTKPGYVTSHMLLDANVPEKKKVTIAGFEQSVFFIDRNTENIDTVRYKHPFTKWAYDVKESRFKEDMEYLKEFESGIFKEDILAKELADKEAARNAALKAAKDKAALDLKEADRKRHADMRLADKKKTKIVGKLLTSGANQKAIVNAKVSLVNDEGKTIETTSTNVLGDFAFTQSSSDKNFGIITEEVESKFLAGGTGIFISNKDGKEMGKQNLESAGKFKFRLLAADHNTFSTMEVSDADLRVDVQGKFLKTDKNGPPLAGLKVNYVDENGNVIASVTTDKEGKFKFSSLNYDAFYLFGVTEADGQLKDGEKIVLVDKDGNVVREITKGGLSPYQFEIVPSENNGIANIYYNDPWLQMFNTKKPEDRSATINTIIIKESVYFNSADATLLPEAKRKLDGVIHVMENVPDIIIELSSHTDSKGSDDYNMSLSQKRAKAAQEYILSHGIASNRITGKGYGESSLVNKCANGIECSEEEHAQNRRLEFKITRK